MANYRHIRWTITKRRAANQGNVQATAFELRLAGSSIGFDIPNARGAVSAAFPVGSQSWRYLRWTITETRDVNSGTCQCAEFQLLSGGSPVAWPGSTVVTNPGGTVVDPVANLIDGNSDSKWGDSAHNANGESVIHIDTTAAGVSFDSYRIYTGNDASGRDPFVWVLEGSDDNTSWTTIDDHPYTTGDPASGEVPCNLLDENDSTKWNVANGVGGALTFEWNFAFTTGFDAYRYQTGNDDENRDPVSWTLEGSLDGSSWDLLDTRTDETITTSRTTFTQDFSVSAPAAAGGAYGDEVPLLLLLRRPWE